MKNLILFLPLILLAFVKVYVNKKIIYPGDEVVYTIEATGNNIKFPEIKKIDNFPILGHSESENISIINGNMQKSISKSYIFSPTKSITIPSFNVIVDNKTYKTKPIKIEVTTPKETNNTNYKLSISVNKKNVFIGEPVILKIKFFKNINSNPQSIGIQRPSFQDFFVKELSQKTYNKNNYSVTEYSFLLIPQKAGNYKIGPILAKIGYLSQENNPFNDPFFNMMFSTIKYKNIYSNSIDLNISPIPSNTIYGNFKANLIANKTEVKANEPVKVTLNIQGCGDFYDLGNFKLNIKDATIYENSPNIKTFIKNNKLCGTYTKEFTIISNHNIIIPPITFNSFDGKIHNIKTNKIFIKVKETNIQKQIPTKNKIKKVIKTKIVYKNNYIELIIAVIVGIIIGILATVLIKNIKIKNEDNLIKQIKKANDKELFNILLEFSNNPEIEKILKQLEENIYRGKKNKINKKEIIKIVKKLTNL